ncbi:protein ORF120 [Lake sturgeon herpesvirus]|nr:protein ORF120 [Lake sturgeon herpesvirus]
MSQTVIKGLGLIVKSHSLLNHPTTMASSSHIEISRPVNCTLSSLKERLVALSDHVPDTIRIYYAHSISQVKYLECHLTIYLTYLSPRKFLNTANGVFYTYINLSLAELEIFLICLYMKFHKYIDGENRVVHPHHINCTLDQWVSVIEIAYYYDLKWLCLTYERLKNECLTHRPGLWFRYNDEEVVCLVPGQPDLKVVTTPAHTKAFTTAVDGTVYCLSVPAPSTREIWVKYNHNQWILVSAVYNAVPVYGEFQLTIAETTCLYVLGDGRHLEYYHLVTRMWRKIDLYPPTGVDYILAEAGDGSVSGALLIANSFRSQVDLFKTIKTAWSMDVANYQKLDVMHSRSAFYASPSDFIETDPQEKIATVNWLHTPNPALMESIRQSIMTNDNNIMSLASINRDPPFNPQWPKPVIADDDRMSTCPLKPDERWVRALVVNGVVYARRQNGDWLYLKEGWRGWLKVENQPSHRAHLIWKFGSHEPVWVFNLQVTAGLAEVKYDYKKYLVKYTHPMDHPFGNYEDDDLQTDSCCKTRSLAPRCLDMKLSLIGMGYMDTFCNPHTKLDKTQTCYKIHRYPRNGKQSVPVVK